MKRIYDLQMMGGLHFEFTEDDRKHLAKLRAGQELIIEGTLDRFVHPENDSKGRGSIYFEDCKIVSAAKN